MGKPVCRISQEIFQSALVSADAEPYAPATVDVLSAKRLAM